MKAIGWNAGLRGDIIMNTVVARSFKETAPDSHLTLGVGPQFADMELLFRNHPHIDGFHAYAAYDNWPSQEDRDYLIRTQYDAIFNPMPQHTHPRWFNYLHQTAEACLMNGLELPSDSLQCHLTRWFDVPDYSNYIALNYIGAFYAGYPNHKSFTPEQAAALVRLIRKKGYKVIHLGHPNEPDLEGTERVKMGFFESVRTMLGCRALVGIDSALSWCASAYSHPVIAAYGSEYYGDRVCAIQPINPEGRYVSELTVAQISVDKIEQEMKNMGI